MSILPNSATTTATNQINVRHDPTPLEPISDPRIQQVIERLPSILHDRLLTLEQLAEPLGISFSHLRQRFKKLTGMTLWYYVKSLRLETARRLLATEYLTLKQVMARVGLSDVTHFNRDFRKVYGVSPRDYRDRHCQAAAVCRAVMMMELKPAERRVADSNNGGYGAGVQNCWSSSAHLA